ncbi:MAG: hypothetical protein DMF90_20810 [Acidobacteria bacterium]|nr:MAG: hypothetical protein DMF90_20810 [Acidobacteriota bacterium]
MLITGGVFQLPHVAGPVILLESRERPVVNPVDASANAVGVFAEKVLDERRNVLSAFAQRGQVDRDDVQPVEQVLLEPALGHHLAQVAVGGGDDPDVHLFGALGAERLELALLQHAQQL